MFPWLMLLFLFSYSSALKCYKGQYFVLSNGQLKFEDFHMVNCSGRHAACARWTIEHPQTTTVYYGCTTRCRGAVACCGSNLCNDKWREEYRNLTKQVVEVLANPNAMKVEIMRKVSVAHAKLRVVRKGEEARLPGEPEMKALVVAPKGEEVRSVLPWVTIGLFGIASLIICCCSIMVCLLTKQMTAKGSKVQEDYTIKFEDN